MKRFLGPVIMALILALVGKAQAGWAAGLFAGASAFVVTLFLGSLVRSRAIKKAPTAPSLQDGEQALLHGPVGITGPTGTHEGWAYLSDRRISLMTEDDSVSIALKDVDELRPPKRSLWAAGELGLVAKGQLWRLKVPDSARWQALLQSAVRAKA